MKTDMKIEPGKEKYEQIIAIFLFCIGVLIIGGIRFKANIILLFLICIMLCIVFMRHYIAVGRTIIMDHEGCIVIFGRYYKKYRWDELIVKRLERRFVDDHKITVFSKMKIAVFAPHKIYKYYKNYKKGQWKASTYCMTWHPLSIIFVRLVSDIELEKVKSEKKYDNYLSYVVSERIFLEKLDGWDVKLEDLT